MFRHQVQVRLSVYESLIDLSFWRKASPNARDAGGFAVSRQTVFRSGVHPYTIPASNILQRYLPSQSCQDSTTSKRCLQPRRFLRRFVDHMEGSESKLKLSDKSKVERKVKIDSWICTNRSVCNGKDWNPIEYRILVHTVMVMVRVFWGFSRDNMLIRRQAYGFPRVSCFAYALLHHCSENGVELNRCLLPLSISVYNRLHHIDYFFVFVPNENNQIRTETETDEIQQDWERNALSFARFSDPKPAWFVQGWRSLAGHWSQVTWHKMTIFVIIQS